MDQKKNKQEDGLFIFAEEHNNNITTSESEIKWKILIVDDEDEVHNVTKLALSDVKFKEMSIEFLHAYSEKEAIDVLNNNPDISIILLDIVMEEEDSGLKLIQYIRDKLKNSFIRIVIRTGQPGQAPERKIIVDYDINDYKEKTELTSNKLFSTIIASLRSYDNLMDIEKNRKSLEKIIEKSNYLFSYREIHTFAHDILNHIIDIFSISNPDSKHNPDTFIAIKNDISFVVYSGKGIFSDKKGSSIVPLLPQKIITKINESHTKNIFINIKENYLINTFKSKTNSEYLIFAKNINIINENQVAFLKLVFNTISSAFDNICLSNDIINTQSELLITLGEVVETRSKETGNHVRRVAEYSKILALKYGLDKDEAELIKQASPMHDVGKVGIFDEILNKPGKLTADEFENMKKHTVIGYEIFKNSGRSIFKAASIIALQHHEKYDGTGYPKGLRGKDIHIYGRITTVADIFDAIGSNRLYKKAWELEDILDYLKNESGRFFDPELIKLFFENLDEILLIKEKFKE